MDKQIDCIYVFGAGASYNTHPTVDNFFESIEEALSSPDNFPFEKYRGLLKKIKKYGTPDAYAKKIYDSTTNVESNEEYLLIKELYNCWIDYFTGSDFYPGTGMMKEEMGFEHIAKGYQERIDDAIVVDRRYVSFFKNFCKNEDKSNNLFYTWNYDLSLVHTCEYLDLSYLIENIIHLNGQASGPYKSAHEIKFFWENKEGPVNIPLSEKIVFIGYSFPKVNMRQDVNFFTSSLRSGANIFLQNPCSMAKKVERMLVYNGFYKDSIKLIELKDVEEFFIP